MAHHVDKAQLLHQDNVPLRKSLADILTVSGYRVSGADSARELYQLIGDRAFDVAVVDINLPHHDGFSITRYLAENKLCSVIITSARDAVEDRVKGYQCGADIYMVKPIELEELVAAIARLGAARGARELGRPGTGPSWTYDAKDQILWAPNANVVTLSRRESQLISVLVQAQGAILSRGDIPCRIGRRGQWRYAGAH